MKLGTKQFVFATSVLIFALGLFGCGGGGSSSGGGGTPPPPPPPTSFQLTVMLSGTGAGSVTSSPTGIDCGTTCSATYNTGTVVQLTAAASTGSTFTGWSGNCAGTGTCQVTLSQVSTVTATFDLNNTPTLQSSINHIIVMVQENRSFDHYFGALRQYWADNGYPDQAFDGLPQFPTSSPAGPAPTNLGCDPAFPAPSDCIVDSASPIITSFPLSTVCLENPSPTWNEAHTWFNRLNPTSGTPLLDGFVKAAAHDSRSVGFFDQGGVRVMGYYNDVQLPYYYFMASNFSTSDTWYSPVMTRTAPNRMFMLAATSGGHVYPLNSFPHLTEPIIFQILQNAGISWKIYVHPAANGKTDAASLFKQSYIQNFTYGQTILNTYPQNLVPISQYFTDLQNGTLPSFGFIEPASAVSLDEHASDQDTPPNVAPNIKAGANYVSTLINGLMGSSSWKDSIFILTYDEAGGFYDHVAPVPTVSPDGIAPIDLLPGDTCTVATGPTCDFTYTGYRVPLIVVSPFAKKNYVSHTVADYTAVLKLVETRFGLASMTARDAAQIDMTEFFDFSNPPWMTPPTPPAQSTSGPCYLDHVP
jgi:phospholipase C